MSDLRNVSSNPHIRAKDTTSRIMLTVVIALLLPAFFGIYNFGFRALVLILISIATCVLTEYIYEKLMKKPITIGDFSAVVTGLLLALNLPVSVPFWIPVVGGVFAILVVKMLFGGLGQNFMNPALAGRCFLLISFTSLMTNFNCDAYTGATPLASLKAGESVNVLNMILGRTAGTIGETSVIAIVLGACVLIVAGVIDLRVPGSYIASFAVFVLLFAALSGIAISPAYLSAQLAGGGLMLGAFFMATDYVTRPVTKKGQYIYGVILGFLTAIFRIFGASAEGVSYAIIFCNLLVPLIFGKVKKREQSKKIMDVLEKVNIAELKDKRVNQLSGGQKQRVAIARALINSPEYILADEPTGALDSNTSDDIMDVFEELNKNGHTVIIVTHDNGVAARCQRVIEIKDGEVLSE